MGMAALFGVTAVKAAPSKSKKEVVGTIVEDQKVPLFSGAVRHGTHSILQEREHILMGTSKIIPTMY